MTTQINLHNFKRADKLGSKCINVDGGKKFRSKWHCPPGKQRRRIQVAALPEGVRREAGDHLLRHVLRRHQLCGHAAVVGQVIGSLSDWRICMLQHEILTCPNQVILSEENSVAYSTEHIILPRTCSVEFGYNSTVCSHLGRHDRLLRNSRNMSEKQS